MEPQVTKLFKKMEKQSFHDFLNRLHVIIANPDGKKDPANEAFKHIKKGFKEKVENNHIEELCKYIFAWSLFPKLALRIALEANLRRSNTLIDKLFRKMKIEMAVRVKYPSDRIPLFTNISSYERQKELQEWINSNQKDGVLDHEWSRSALVCLLGRPMLRDDFHAIHNLVENCSRKKGKKAVGKKSVNPGVDKGNQYSTYVKLVAPLFISEKPASSKVNFGLGMAQIFIDQAQKLEADNSELKDIHASLRTQLQEYRERVAEKDSSLNKLSSELEMVQKDIEIKKALLKEESERYKLLDKHWQEKSGHELARQTYTFKKYFSFEIKEAVLSLDTDHPDVAMALNRIRHMEEYLLKMETANESK